MQIKKLIINGIFQLAAIFLIIRLISLEKIDFSILSYFFSNQTLLIFSLIILSKLSMSFLFFALIKMISKSNIIFSDITSIFLQGGIISMLVPGAGLIFKYYKLNFSYNINLAEYSISQSFWSLSSILSYVSLAFILGFIKVVFSSLNYGIYLLSIFFILLAVTFAFRSKIYLIIKYILSLPRFQNLLIDLKKIKVIFLEKKLYFFIIFITFFFQALFQCFIFFLAVNLFEINISFLDSSFIYISSSIVAVISLINFIGFFELLLTLSASLIVDNYMSMAVFGLGFRLLNIISLFLIILSITTMKVFKKKLNK